jgi:hypothetical protein
MAQDTYARKGQDQQGMAFSSQYTSTAIWQRKLGKLTAQNWDQYTSKRAQKRSQPRQVAQPMSDRKRVALKLGGLSLPERIALGIPAEIAKLHVADWTSNDIKMAAAIMG